MKDEGEGHTNLNLNIDVSATSNITSKYFYISCTILVLWQIVDIVVHIRVNMVSWQHIGANIAMIINNHTHVTMNIHGIVNERLGLKNNNKYTCICT